MPATSSFRLLASLSRTLFSHRMLVALTIAAALLALGGLTLAAAAPGADAPASAAVSSYAISKQLIPPSPVRRARDVTFFIRITNTGETWITTLPLRDVYSPTYLAYGDCGVQQTAAPWPDDYADDGQLDWSDLTAAAPYGFGTDLAPGASLTIVVTFTAAADTAILPGEATENRAVVHDAVADPDVLSALPEQASTAGVRIITPTCAARPSGGAWRASDGSPALQPTCSFSIGGQVWHDVNFDGDIFDQWDAGIDGALLNAYWDDGDHNFEPGAGDLFYQSAVTGPPSGAISGHGVYDFRLPPPSICGEGQPSGLWVDVDQQ